MHTVLPIDDLLARIRQACLDYKEADVSLCINIERSREKTVFRLNLQPDGSLAATVESASPPLQPPATMSPTPQQPTPHNPSPRSVSVQSDDNNRMEVDEEAREARHPCSSEDGASSSAPASSSPSNSDLVVVEPPTQSQHNIRRSARQQHRPDRLAYPLSTVSRLGVVTAQQGREPKRAPDSHKQIRAVIEESTDTEGSDSSRTPSLSLPIQRRPQHKRRRVEARGNIDDGGEEEQIAAVVAKLKEGHSRRQQQELDVSKHALLQLGRDILGECNNNDNDAFEDAPLSVKAVLADAHPAHIAAMRQHPVACGR